MQGCVFIVIFLSICYPIFFFSVPLSKSSLGKWFILAAANRSKQSTLYLSGCREFYREEKSKL